MCTSLIRGPLNADFPEDLELDHTGTAQLGTSQALEKHYLRLTPGMLACIDGVRPPDVVQRALEHIKIKRREGAEYEWVCDQLKAMRQDLVVQGVRSNVTVRVYEFHARLALECGDLASYHQCQGALKSMHSARVRLWMQSMLCVANNRILIVSHKNSSFSSRVAYPLGTRQDAVTLRGIHC